MEKEHELEKEAREFSPIELIPGLGFSYDLERFLNGNYKPSVSKVIGIFVYHGITLDVITSLLNKYL